MNKYQKVNKILYDNQADINILDIARSLHMANTTSMDCDYADKLAKCVQLYLKDWEDSRFEEYRKFDEAVKHLLEVVLEEYEKENGGPP